MFGQVNRTLVQQFRMPGYPFVLVTTELLQEGEDLHTFCSAIHHYGISWMPSSMEQRIGRIDRVRSQTDRRLTDLARDAEGDELLQVHFPHLQDTVEILQVERVLERMNVFLRLMHEGLVTAGAEDKHIDVAKTLARGRRPVEVISGRLKAAFPVPVAATKGDVVALAVDESFDRDATTRLVALRTRLAASLGILWERSEWPGQLLGTFTLTDGRIQPFTLFLDSIAGRILVRCVSPVGVVNLDDDQDEIEESLGAARVRLGAVLDREEGSYNLTVQEDVLLAEPVHDAARIEAMLRRVLEQADRLELIHLPGTDSPMERFVDDLRQEGAADRD